MPAQTLKDLTIELQRYTAAAEAQRVATNTANKAKTAARKALLAYIKDHKKPPETTITLGSLEYSYAVAEADVIPPEKLLTMYNNADITEAQLLQCLSVLKGDAELVIGADQVALMSERVKGEKPDLRVKPAAEPTKDATVARVNLPVAAKVPAKLSIKPRRRLILPKPGLRTFAKPKPKQLVRVKR